MDGVLLGYTTAHPAPDYANGGVNRVPGFMNRSNNTKVRVDWFRWTPESTVVANGGPYR